MHYNMFTGYLKLVIIIWKINFSRKLTNSVHTSKEYNLSNLACCKKCDDNI